LACEPRELRRGDCAADSGSNPGLTSRRRGAGCAGVDSVRLGHRVERALGPCRWGAWQSGSRGWERTRAKQTRLRRKKKALTGGPGLSETARAWALDSDAG